MKKFLSLLLVAMMALSLVATANAASLAGTYDITVWVANEIVDLTKAQIEEFNNTNEMGIVFNATIEAVGEGDAATQMITDVAAGGDLFCFAQDQFARLVQAGALNPLGVRASETVKATSDEGAYLAATAGETLYAYPLTADNTYFMYYDKSVIPEEHIGSLEAIIADCEAAQKYFAFEMQTSAWYLASFFFGTGCESEWTTGDDGEFISVKDTFNSPEGLIAAKGIKKLVDSPFHLSSSAADAFASNAAVVVTGTWASKDIEKMLGENMGVAELPSFEVDGQSYHIGSYFGFKLLGVKPQEDVVKGAALHQLAQYLTNYECQMERFEANGWGPANLEAQKEEAVLNDPILTAVRAQREYSKVQGQIHGSWWDIAKVIGDDVKAANDEAGLQTALDNYYDKIASLFTMTADEKNAWGVIGTCNLTDGFFYTDYNNETRSNWTDDMPMVEVEAGVWKTDKAYEMEAGVEFKVRQGKSWDNAFPADNFKVAEAGTYYVVLNTTTGEVSLVTE